MPKSDLIDKYLRNGEHVNIRETKESFDIWGRGLFIGI
jgi:hypothetical protein